MEPSLDQKQLTQLLAKQDQWNKAVIFNQDLKIIASKNCPVEQKDLAPYLKACENRDVTIGQGFKLLGDSFEVHRWHPPLVYGRRGDAENGEGISLAVGKGKDGKRIFVLITYLLPIVSARAVPKQINFFNENSKHFLKVGSLQKI